MMLQIPPPLRITPSAVIGLRTATFFEFRDGSLFDAEHVLNPQDAVRTWTDEEVPVYEEQEVALRFSCDDWTRPITATFEFSLDGVNWFARGGGLMGEDPDQPGTSWLGIMGTFPDGGWARLRIEVG